MDRVTSLLSRRSWVAVRRSGPWVGDRVGPGLVPRPIPVRDALAFQGLVVLENDEWSFVFAPPGRRVDPVALADAHEEVCGFSVDDPPGERRCVRYRRGELVRVLEQPRSGPLRQAGRPGHRREPRIERLDAAGMLAFARAWRCDPRAVLADPRAVAWVLEPAGAVAPPRAGTVTPPRAGTVTPRPRDDPRWTAAALGLVGVLGVLAYATRDLGGTFSETAGTFELRPADRCRSEATCEACSACATAEPPCAPLATACGADPACVALVRCFDGCGAERAASVPEDLPPEGFTLSYACDLQCVEAHEAGVERYRAWRTCTWCDVCEDRCAWELRLGMGDRSLVTCPEP